MALEPGTRLGPYEIVAPLGSGGMGVVYRARDSRLGREVALKVVADHVDATADVRTRFEREARAIASLSHPHICALYDVGTYEGSDFLVMELLTGESLADRLARDRLPMDQALRIGAQILDALARAHASGIVHRDLKPGNVMLTPTGVKLLDFGLAQLRSEEAPPVEALSGGPTRLAPLTTEGMVLGTLQYLPPEQLEGRSVDARSDLFAFGAVFYEMVTGTMAFPGSNIASVISSVLRDHPPPISERSPFAPPALDHLVRRCLAKDPDDRWQSAHDLCLQLEGMLAAAPGTSAGSSGAAVAPTRATTAEPARLPRRQGVGLAVVFIVVAALAGGLLAGALLYRNEEPAVRQAVRFELPPPQGGVFYSDVETVSLAVSPDGRHIAFLAPKRAAAADGPPPNSIWIRDVASLAPTQIEGTDGASSIFWSPDGSEIGFFAGPRLKRVALGGGSPQVVCEVKSGQGLAGTWGRDVIVFSNVQGATLEQVRLDAGAPQPETLLARDSQDDALRIHWPWFLPDGESLLFVEGSGVSDSRLMILPAGGTPREVAALTSRVEMVASDRIVFARDGGLYVQRLDTHAGLLVGPPEAIAPAVSGFRATRWAAFSASRNGTVALAWVRDESYLAWFDRSGQQLETVGEPGSRLSVRVSSDGRQALADRYDVRSESYDVSLLDLERNVETAVGATDATEAFPVWMDAGRHLIYSSARRNSPKLFQRDLERGDERQLLVGQQTFQIAEDMAADGRLVLRQRGAAGGFKLYSMRLGGETRQPAEPTLLWGADDLVGAGARLSADGRFVAYLGLEAGRPELFVRPFDGPGAPIRVSPDGARALAWSSDDRELFFLTLDRRMFAAPISMEPKLDVGRAVELFELGGLGWTNFDVAPDGRFLAIVESAHGNQAPLTVIVGWTPGQ